MKKIMKKVVVVIIVVYLFCFGWFMGDRKGNTTGWQRGYEKAWADYELGFKHGRRSQHDYKAEFQTSEFQWTGYMDGLAEILCEQEGIAYEVNEPTLGYKIVCPKCVCGGALYQQEQTASMYYGFHYVSELEKLKPDESVDLSVDHRGQTYCAKCLYPVSTDWKIVDLSEPIVIAVPIEELEFDVSDPNCMKHSDFWF